MKSILKAFSLGLMRAIASPVLVFVLWLLGLVAVLPLAIVMEESIHDSIGTSLVNENLRTGFDMGWFSEFEDSAEGLEATFTPTLVGAGGMFANLEDWMTGDLFDGNMALIGMGILYALLWVLLLGGIISRYAKFEGALSLSSFFSDASRYFLRFARLALLSGVFYYFVYRLGGWLFQTVESLTRDVTVEKTVLLLTALAAAAVVFLLCLINMVFDYAKIVTVVDGRRSMLLAAVSGLVFVFTNPFRTFGLYYLMGALSLLLLLAYHLGAPGAEQSSLSGVAYAFLIGQLYLILKLMIRLATLAGETALYREIP